MSITYHWMRIAPGQFARCLDEPSEDVLWALDHEAWLADRAVLKGGPVTAAPPGRVPRGVWSCLWWDVYAFLLSDAGCPVDIVHGGASFAGYEDRPDIPEYLRPDEVSAAADWLCHIGFDELVAAPADDDPRWEHLYKTRGSRRTVAEHWPGGPRQTYEDELVPFFSAARDAGEAVLRS
jgi:uncharacterized protein DUF1877